jgi:wobble nucleotide-excising tRNase
MIERVDISNFGSFKNFIWNDSVRDKGNNIGKFKKFNIIYGRNYSGKTTLSRIFRCLDTGCFPKDYNDPNFTIYTNSGGIDQNEIPTNYYHIRVYNRDFIDDHLSFLKDRDGKITPFAIIGRENKEIENKLSQIKKSLGSEESKSGLRYFINLENEEYEKKKKEYEEAEKKLKIKLKKKATQPPHGIKHNPLYKDPNYNTPKIETDINKIFKMSIEIISKKEKEQKEKLLSEKQLPEIGMIFKVNTNIKELYSRTKKLLLKKISPTEPVQELLNDALLQTWVKEGIPLHKNKRSRCAFCGNNIPVGLWVKLDKHFNEESAELEAALYELKDIINKGRLDVDDIVHIDIKNIYSIFRDSYQNEKKSLENGISKYNNYLDKLISKIESRINDIFSTQKIPEFIDNSDLIQEKISNLNKILNQNNKKAKSLEKDQNKAREELRLNEIAKFIHDINYTDEKNIIENRKQEFIKAENKITEISKEVSLKEEEIEKLTNQLKDEKKGADKVNEYLNHHFGHKGLRLEANENDAAEFKFQILRGDDPAYNLSEGECSLIAFCYFIARLEDADTSGKKLIIYLDDPVSSLDSNHIFFIYSLIQSVIANPISITNGQKNYRYEQLFISTHNLEFLKYLKRLPRSKNNWENFHILLKDNSSTIEIMPSYLKDYASEFNYLFGEIYVCAHQENINTKSHCFYNFGNNLRKFLEAYLFFKYPYLGDYNEKIKRFFKDDPHIEPLVQRISNEFSHLGGVIDRSSQPIEYPEICKLAKFVLKKIKENDSDQFKYLLKSINESDPFDET